MENYIDISIIIPHRNSKGSLNKLLSTIKPHRNIEIIIIDNSEKNKLEYKDLIYTEGVKIDYSPIILGAGGARNKGIELAKGKWMLFADADDYFTTNALEILQKFIKSDNDIIYFKTDSIYINTDKKANRHQFYNQLIDDYIRNRDEQKIKFLWTSPCNKLIRHEIIKKYSIRFHTTKACNDAYFSIVSGYYCNKMEVSNEIIYVITSSNTSITSKKDFKTLECRYKETILCNEFLKKKNLKSYCIPMIGFLFKAIQKNPLSILNLLYFAYKHDINPFINCMKKNRQ